MNIREQITGLLKSALDEAQRDKKLPTTTLDDLSLERPQNLEHGDFASSIPLKLARPMHRDPMAIAKTLVSLIPTGGFIDRISAESPGFINVFLNPGWLAEQVDAIRLAGATYGNVELGAGQRVQVEFVSVNPTGPLHVGHARGAVFGSALAKIMSAAGYDIVCEYYINDAGTQMEKFNKTLYARYRQQFGIPDELPPDGYQGEYMVALAKELKAEEGDRFVSMPEADAVYEIGKLGLHRMLDAIRTDMEELKVYYDLWFSERSLYENGQYDQAMKLLGDAGYLTEREGATWFTSTALGDDKDKVLVRSTGIPTYFAGDVAYHYHKFLERNFDLVIDVLGADHQGHVPFMKAVVTALGVPQNRLALLIYQLVTLQRSGETVRVSKRTGELVTLRELVDEVGPDACRYFFLSRSPESQMEFDLELAKKQSSENPVYYIQYAHARVASILRLAEERNIHYGDGDLSLLNHEAELSLIRKMLLLPELTEMIARSLEPHHLPHYAIELATSFHWFYQQCRVVSSNPMDAQITRARLKLVEASKIVLARCLDLMSMNAPEQM